MITRYSIHITGRVQGVGCRPFIYRIAAGLGLTGMVYNNTTGVTIQVQGAPEKIGEFVRLLSSGGSAPALLKINSYNRNQIPVIAGEKDFKIRFSDAEGEPVSQVTPDTAVCDDCLREMTDGGDFRCKYPFINCTNCGPRYSIVKTIPYDRPNTTMADFTMCPACSLQYHDVADRRFHAQPIACPSCGPKIWLCNSKGVVLENATEAVIEKTAELLRNGRIVAVKGIGGFHLAVDAFNNHAVTSLRQRKRHDHKPFAIMAATIEKIRQFAFIDPIAEELLTNPAAPIVLLPKKTNTPISPSVAPCTNTFGFMLCYAPLHHLLFAQSGIEVLVMTSANISDEPLIRENAKALRELSGIADAFLMHDRDIYRQIDDSVFHIIDGRPAPLRRARGCVPEPILSKKSCTGQIFAAGADMKNTFCFAKQNQFIISEHIGDLDNAPVYRHYMNSIEHLGKLFNVRPDVVACDLHPGYLSTGFAESLNASKILHIQHHWAHIASVLAENDLPGPVIGLVADGTGYGTDGSVWGCECLIASLESFDRFGHLRYYPLAGADLAAKHAIRPLLGLTSDLPADSPVFDRCRTILKNIEPDPEIIRVISEQLKKNLNTVPTSSLGRVFDAVAAILGLGNCNYFEAQLPMALEAIADSAIDEQYDFEIYTDATQILLLDVRKIIENIINDVHNGISAGVISAKFHNSVAAGLFTLACRAREKSGIKTVALSGGVFCNRFLANRLISMLKQNDFSVLFNRLVPAGDGGISLGQAAIAAELISKYTDHS